VDGVEVEIDDGDWLPAALGEEVAPTMWRQWRLDWDAPAGEHTLRVRTIGRRRRQPEGSEPPYPVGSRGYDERRVSVEPGNGRRRQTGHAVVDDVRARLHLGVRGLKAWHDRGYPPTPRFPPPSGK
jgi:hypothetical protein